MNDLSKVWSLFENKDPGSVQQGLSLIDSLEFSLEELKEVFPLDLKPLGNQGTFSNRSCMWDCGAAMLVGLHVLGHYVRLGDPEALRIRAIEILWSSSEAHLYPFFSIPEWLEEWTGLERISLAVDGLRKFPSFILSQRPLRELSLSRTSIGTLPKEIGALTKLELLDLEGLKLKKLPTSIVALTALKSLEVAPQVILPPGMDALQSLLKLGLSANPHLEFSFTELPEWVSNLENLEELDLSEHGQLVNLDRIHQLRNLKTLWLQGTQFSQYEQLLSRLPWVEKIYTSHPPCFGCSTEAEARHRKSTLSDRIVWKQSFEDTMDQCF